MAITLVILCIIPLFLFQVSLYQQEVELCEQVQLERWADLSYLEAVEILQMDPKKVQETHKTFILEDPAVVLLGNGKVLSFERTFSLKKDLNSKADVSSVDLDVVCSLKNSKHKVYTYPYRVIIKHEKEKK